jgi:hexosaminidase
VQALGAPQIALSLDGGAGDDPEGYRLTVAPERIEIAAPAPAGVFYGLQTLRQLVEHAEPLRRVPALTVRDAPRFRYRGLHLDVGRHMFPVEFIKRYIDLMALYKINTFHWHLTEDQGWRIEIERYPRLTEVGSCRRETIVGQSFEPYVGDGTPYCGYYTREEVREVVAHAATRYVTVIPEIEMPGHSLAALAAYPELACTEGPFEVGTRWGVFEDIYCPSERTFAFLEGVLSEVMALFPGSYIHIGGDEAPKMRWEGSEVAQAVIAREGLADEHELQSWFIRRIEQFLALHGRRLIGWDEILEGGLPPKATVMSWRGMEGGIEAARQGHDVIMTPGSHLYFDHYQGDAEAEPPAIGGYSPIEKVYAFEPVPAELTADEAEHVIGAQANVWTEYMKTPDHVEYMVFPRFLALSEVVWSPQSARDWESFVARLPQQLVLLDRLGVNYRRPVP